MAEFDNVRRFESAAERWRREQAALNAPPSPLSVEPVREHVAADDDIAIVSIDAGSGFALDDHSIDALAARLRATLAYVMLVLAVCSLCGALLVVYRRYRDDTRLVDEPAAVPIERRAQKYAARKQAQS